MSQAGETLHDSVDANFQQVEQALRIARDGAGYESFKISVGRIEDANLPFIPLALIRFQALYPDITVERHETNTAQQIVTPKRNSIDLGLFASRQLAQRCGDSNGATARIEPCVAGAQRPPTREYRLP